MILLILFPTVIFGFCGFGVTPLVASSSCGRIKYNHDVIISKSISLNCCGQFGLKNAWVYGENDFLYLNMVKVGEQRTKGTSILKNYTLLVQSVHFFHEGVYSCTRNMSPVMRHFLQINVPPRVLMLHNGSTLVNATYDRDRVNYVHSGKETYVEEGSQVNVTCLAEGAKPEATLTWTGNRNPSNTTVYELTERNQQENRTTDTTSVLQFRANEKNLTITCNSSLNGTDITTLVSATFLTYVKPTVFYLLNGKLAQDSIYVPENKHVNISCFAKGARPAADLTLEGYNKSVESTSIRSSDIDSMTLNSSSTLVLQAKYDNALFSCTVTIPEIRHSETIRLELKTFVLPKPVITVNGGRSNEVKFDRGDTVTIICNASTARPTPTLTLTRNGKTFHDSESDNSGSSGVIVFFHFLPENHGEVVMCISFLGQVNLTKVANVTFHHQTVTETSNKTNVTSWVLFPTAIAVVVLLAILMACCSARRRNGSKSTDLSALQLALRERPIDGLTHISRDLPEIRQSISPDEDATEVIYDDVKTSTLSDVQMLIQLPGEGTFQYWTANASFENESSKKVIVKCLSESSQLKEHFNLRTLAEHVKTLKSHRNVVEILGVSITNVPYYIYLEYLEYGTLRDFLLRNYQQSRDSQCNITQTLDERTIQLTGFALDVADGLIYLTDRDYCHPALCSRKILLTKIGTCKLYDFWPKQLSAERINQILAKSVPPVAWLSPETIFLNNYFDKSDVWTFGITLWEIYSLGETPYKGFTYDEIEQEIRKMRYLDQPLTCPGGLFSMMLASWDKTVDKRPDLTEWKQKLVCLLQTAKEDFGDKYNTEDNGDKSYFTLENNICDYEDDYIEQ